MTGVALGADRRGRVVALVSVLALALAGFFALAEASVESDRVVDLDVRVEEWVAGQMPSFAEWLARPFTWVGGMVGVALLAGTVAFLLLRARRGADAWLVLGAAVGAQLLVPVLKSIYDRPRPQAGSPIHVPSSASFPSGHATSGIALFGAFALIAAGRAGSPRSAAGLLAGGLFVGVAVGASRVVLNVHFVSDVLAGFCVGLALLCACLLVRELAAGRSS